MANDRRIAWRVDDVAIKDAYGSNAVELDVHYSKGGTNYFSGGYTKPGYYLVVMAVKRSDGATSFVIGGNVGKSFYLAYAPRFNAKKLEQLATALKPHTGALVAALLARNYDGINGIVAATVVTTTPVPTLTHEYEAEGAK